IDEQELPVVPLAMHPARQPRRLAGVAKAQFATGMGAIGVHRRRIRLRRRERGDNAWIARFCQETRPAPAHCRSGQMPLTPALSRRRGEGERTAAGEQRRRSMMAKRWQEGTLSPAGGERDRVRGKNEIETAVKARAKLIPIDRQRALADLEALEPLK